MKDKRFIISIVVSVAAICISVAALVVCFYLRTSYGTGSSLSASDSAGSSVEDAQYILYLGTNDKDTNEPVYTREKSKSILKDILLEHMGGYTIQEAEGGWTDDNGTIYQEYTIVIYLTDTTPEKVYALCDELLDKFNQSSVLIRTNSATTEFYSGPGN